MRLRMIAALFVAAAGIAKGQSGSFPSGSGDAEVVVHLASFKFTPSTIELQRGVPVRLHLINTASGGHDFVARAFFADSDIASSDRSKVSGGKVELDGGESVDIVLTPTKAGSYDLRCSHFMHATFGMKGRIEVR